MTSSVAQLLLLVVGLLTIFTSPANAHALFPRQAPAAGYLAAAFLGNVPSVFFHVAAPDSPSTFQRLNGGQPSLVPTQGTKGARDPFIFFSQDRSKLYVLATDLDIGKTNWNAAQTNGSRSIFIWESSDGLNWSQDRLVELMPATAGYVWAPSAIWDVDREAYAVFWSSRVYDAADASHTGTPQGPFIYYSHTNDFTSFTAPARWEPETTITNIDQEIQYLGGTTYIRYISDTSVTKVVLDRSDTGLFGPWTRVGTPVDKVREGPASYQDILRPERYYLWEDDYQTSGAGYECYYTETFEIPYTPCETPLSPRGMRHGGVVQVDAEIYSALLRNVTS
ncbi:proline-tRNA ligase [Elsinoe australis]|uniref:Proline-tRNA ligase n=1 Tax=Elsinoe australis TaxID=40998 RepID=A0A2P8AIJ7_9PEZI|nr:proline-tRNA ligase [Elsinoe australis]